MSLHDEYRNKSVEEILDFIAMNLEPTRKAYLEGLLSVRVAELVVSALQGTAQAMGNSAVSIRQSLDSA